MRGSIRVAVAVFAAVLGLFAVPAAAQAAGTIIIVKDAEPNSAQDFTFFTDGVLTPTSFQLDDDSDPTLSNTQVFSDLAPGFYGLGEQQTPGWFLDDASCDDGSSPQSGIDLADGETVTCTFRNKKSNPSITVLRAAPTNTQAGAHPDFDIHVRFCDVAGCTAQQSNADVKSFTVKLPPGMLGNPTEIPSCPEHLFVAFACPDNTKLGDSLTITQQKPGGSFLPVPTPLYNVDAMGLAPARLGTGNLPASPPGPLPVAVTLDSSTEDLGDPTDGDYSVDSALEGIQFNLGGPRATVTEINVHLCGIVARVVAPEASPCTNNPALGEYFFVNPTSCEQPAKVEIEVRGYAHPQDRIRARTGEGSYGPAFTPTGCDTVPFDLGVSAEPDNTKAGAPSGYNVKLDYPDYTNFAVWESALKHAVVKLPQGVSLAAGGGIGLQECSAAQFGVLTYGGGTSPARTTGEAARCPTGSEIGTVSVETPVLKNPGGDDSPPDLTGKVYFGPSSGAGQPTADRPWKLFLLLEGFGLRVKLIGDVTVDGNTGQITTTFLNQPQVPFSNLTLHTDDERPDIGQYAVLANPKNCGNYKVSADFTGYNGDVTHPSDPTGYDISADGAGGACAADRPFQPNVLDASAQPEQAGAHSRSHLLIERPDGHELMNSLNLSLPAGATGSLAAAPLCPASQVNSGNCSAESKVGVIRTTVGTGSGLLKVSGSIYIGEPVVGGDAASFVIVIPAKVGPINLGNVVLVNRVKLRDDVGVEVYSPPIPTIFGGIPLPVREIEIDVNREDFFINPTGCDTRNFVGTFTGDEGGNASSTFPAQAKGCENLPFKPHIKMIAGSKGTTAEGKHPRLQAIVTQENGEASISNARVVVPDLLRPNVPQFNKPGALCNDAQLASRTCPPLSRVGDAKVVSPLLPFALKGPVFIVQTAASPLPKLAVFLQGGGIEVVLSARNGFQGIKILNTFDNVPDVPQSYFQLNINGGSNGILNNFRDLCKTSPLPVVDATFTGHNGRKYSEKPRIETDGCGTSSSASKVRGASIVGSSAKMSRTGVVKLKVRCRNTKARCNGRVTLASKKLSLGRKSFKIAAGKTRAVKVKLTGKGRSAVRASKGMKVRATVKAGSKTSRKTITIRR